jgi:hypothetical protein
MPTAIRCHDDRFLAKLIRRNVDDGSVYLDPSVGLPGRAFALYIQNTLVSNVDQVATNKMGRASTASAGNELNVSSCVVDRPNCSRIARIADAV